MKFCCIIANYDDDIVIIVKFMNIAIIIIEINDVEFVRNHNDRNVITKLTQNVKKITICFFFKFTNYIHSIFISCLIFINRICRDCCISIFVNFDSDFSNFFSNFFVLHLFCDFFDATNFFSFN